MKTARLVLVAVAFFSAFSGCEGVVDDDDDDDDGAEGEGEGDDADDVFGFCVRSLTCARDGDPAATCRQAFEECFADEVCGTLQRDCAEEFASLRGCLDENGTCDETEEGVFSFGAVATAEGGACEGDVGDATACAEDNSGGDDFDDGE